MNPSLVIVARRAGLRAILFSWLAATASADCLPRFGPQDGWLGGDAAYSLPLGDGRSLWLFGDTFVGASTATTRDGAAMIANTIGISTCRGGRWSVRYHWRAGPRPFFPDAAEGEWYWPMDGVVHRGRIYLGLLRVMRAPGEAGPLAFRFRGARLAVVENPRADPAEWRIEYRDWVSSAGVVPAAATAAEERGYAYFLTTVQEPLHPMFLTRIAWDGLERPAAAWEYRNREGRWKPGFDAADAAVLFAPGQTELSVRRRPGTGWIALLAGPGFPSTEIVARRAARLEGPWESPQVLGHLPHGADRFCYAVKEHAQGSDAYSALVTYACNASRPADLAADMTLYFPRAVRVPLRPRRRPR